MNVLQAIRKAEKVLPGKAARKGQIDPRWQVIIRVGDHIEDHPEEVWQFTRKWGCHASPDLRTAIATCLLEHLLEHHFSNIFPLVSEACRQSPRFADTLSRCWDLGQAGSPQNLRRVRVLRREASGPSANKSLKPTGRSRSRQRRTRTSVAAPARR